MFIQRRILVTAFLLTPFVGSVCFAAPKSFGSIRMVQQKVNEVNTSYFIGPTDDLRTSGFAMVGVAPTAPGNVTFSLRIRHYDGNGNLVTQGVATTIVGPGGAGAVGSALDYIVPDPYTPNYSVTLELFSSEDGLLDAKSCTFSSD